MWRGRAAGRAGRACEDDEMKDGYGDEQATLGDRIALGREYAGLSVEALAEKIGVTPTTLEEWEYDQSAPRANRLLMLAGVLNVSLIWLMSGDGEGAGDEGEAQDDETTPAAILRALRQLRIDQVRLAERAGRLERKLRAMIAE